MPLASKRTLVDQVADRLRRDILSGVYPPGAKLQPELELAGRFRVNRFTVREAMNKLEQLRLIARRPGSGTVVLDYTEHANVDVIADLVVSADGRVNPFVVSDLLEAARSMSTEMAALAAARRSDSDLARLRAVVTELARERQLSRAAALDFDFHWALAGAGGNIVPRLVLNSVRGLLRTYGPLLETLYVQPDAVVEGYGHAVDAITARDAERARSLLGFIWSFRHHRFVDLHEQLGRSPGPSPA